MFVREAVAKKYGLNMALEGGDVKQVEIVAPNLPAALATGQVDAASLIHSQAFRAKQSGEFVNICETGQILNDVYGPLVSAVNVGYPERLAARPEAFKEFCRMMKESSAYALSHRDEVFGDLAKVANVDRSFFDWWFDRTTAVPGTFNAKHAAAVTKAWEIAKAFGMIQSVPDASASTPVKASVAAAFAAALLAAWVVGSAHVAPYLLPAPASVARAALAFFTSPRQLGHLGITLFHIGASIALSFVVGAALALLAHPLSVAAPAIHG
eukprot:gene35401-41771_t